MLDILFCIFGWIQKKIQAATEFTATVQPQPRAAGAAGVRTTPSTVPVI